MTNLPFSPLIRWWNWVSNWSTSWNTVRELRNWGGGGGGGIVQAMSRINENNWVFLLLLILNLASDLSMFALNPFVTYNIVLFTNNRTYSVHYTGMGTGKEKKIWSEDISQLFAEKNAIFSTQKMQIKRTWIQVKTWGCPSPIICHQRVNGIIEREMWARTKNHHFISSHTFCFGPFQYPNLFYSIFF